MKTWQDCVNEVGQKLGWLPLISLSTQVPLGFAEKVAELYREEGIKEELRANNEAHKSATRSLIKEAVKLARNKRKRTPEECKNLGLSWIGTETYSHTESEILEKLKL